MISTFHCNLACRSLLNAIGNNSFLGALCSRYLDFTKIAKFYKNHENDENVAFLRFLLQATPPGTAPALTFL